MIERPTLICVTITAVNTAHNGSGSRNASATTSASNAAIITRKPSVNCIRRATIQSPTVRHDSFIPPPPSGCAMDAAASACLRSFPALRCLQVSA